VVLLVLVFELTHPAWYDKIEPGDKAIFWTNVLVALGTLALAGVTYWNVRQTNFVIAGEERRHQQQFAPLVELYRSQNAIDYQNIGTGLALRIHIMITVAFTIQHQRMLLEMDPRVSLSKRSMKARRDVGLGMCLFSR
jgi:hypothetical protein